MDAASVASASGEKKGKWKAGATPSPAVASPWPECSTP